MTSISKALLAAPPAGVIVPSYDRSSLTSGIAHFGVGNFHRAHQALYLDDLFNRGGPMDWALTGIGIRPHDARMRDVLQSQDLLYTVVERGGGQDSARVIGSIVRYAYGPDGPERVLEALSSPQIRIVSLTITEGGYNVDSHTGAFVADNADVQADLRDPHAPRTVFGYLAQALDRRRKAGADPFTVLSCDNLTGNGDVCRNAVVSFCRLREDALAAWVERNVAFPSTMVDRIVPVTTDENRAFVRDRFALDDGWPVVCEPFRQWVIQDAFCAGRPPLERVGAQLVSDVHPYELVKLRLLNTSHVTLAYLGSLIGYQYIHEIADDELYRTFARRMLDDEVTPLIVAPPGVSLEEYKDTVLTRFRNPAIADTAARVASEGSAKVAKFILPSVRDQLARGGSLRMMALAVAGFIRWLVGVDETGARLDVQDAMAERLTAAARQGGPDPLPVLSVAEIFGDLAQSDRFVTDVRNGLESLYRDGSRATVQSALER